MTSTEQPQFKRVQIPFIGGEPTGDLPLYFLRKIEQVSGISIEGESGPLYYIGVKRLLNAVLQPEALEKRKTNYLTIAPRLAEAVATVIPMDSFDCIVCVPSSTPELLLPYRDVLQRFQSAAIDLTPHFTRRFSSTDATPQERLHGTVFLKPAGLTAVPRRVLIIDDVLDTGISAGAVIMALRREWPQAEIEFGLVSPLWLTHHDFPRFKQLQDIMTSVAVTNKTVFANLQPVHATHPIPYFGDPGQAIIATVGVNPAAGEFIGRNWPGSFPSAAALDRRLTSYFKAKTPPPYRWFDGWEVALQLLGHSYGTDAAHLDLSPRATKSMSTTDQAEFRQMIVADMPWFFEVLEMCPNLKSVLMAGGVTNVYIVDFIRRNLPAGYRLSVADKLGEAKAKEGRLYNLVGPKRVLPIFFCGNSPSKDNGRGVLLQAAVRKHLTTLKASGF